MGLRFFPMGATVLRQNGVSGKRRSFSADFFSRFCCPNPEVPFLKKTSAGRPGISETAPNAKDAAAAKAKNKNFSFTKILLIFSFRKILAIVYKLEFARV